MKYDKKFTETKTKHKMFHRFSFTASNDDDAYKMYINHKPSSLLLS